MNNQAIHLDKDIDTSSDDETKGKKLPVRVERFYNTGFNFNPHTDAPFGDRLPSRDCRSRDRSTRLTAHRNRF